VTEGDFAGRDGGRGGRGGRGRGEGRGEGRGGGGRGGGEGGRGGADGERRPRREFDRRDGTGRGCAPFDTHTPMHASCQSPTGGTQAGSAPRRSPGSRFSERPTGLPRLPAASRTCAVSAPHTSRACSPTECSRGMCAVVTRRSAAAPARATGAATATLPGQYPHSRVRPLRSLLITHSWIQADLRSRACDACCRGDGDACGWLTSSAGGDVQRGEEGG
jgi:hypothetical protein